MSFSVGHHRQKEPSRLLASGHEFHCSLPAALVTSTEAQAPPVRRQRRATACVPAEAHLLTAFRCGAAGFAAVSRS